MKIVTRITLSVCGSAACFFYAYAIGLRFPTQFGESHLTGATIVSLFIVALCFLVREPRGAVFAATVVCLMILHQSLWGLDMLLDYRRVGTETWAGDGAGVVLQAISGVPVFWALYLSVPVAIILFLRNRFRKQTDCATSISRTNAG